MFERIVQFFLEFAENAKARKAEAAVPAKPLLERRTPIEAVEWRVVKEPALPKPESKPAFAIGTKVLYEVPRSDGKKLVAKVCSFSKEGYFLRRPGHKQPFFRSRGAVSAR